MTLPRSLPSPLCTLCSSRTSCPLVSPSPHCSARPPLADPFSLRRLPSSPLPPPSPVAATKIIGYARSDLSAEKWHKQLLGGIEADFESGELEKNDAKVKQFEEMSSYTKGPYDKDEGYKSLEEQLQKIEKDDFGGKKAARIFYVSTPALVRNLLLSESPSRTMLGLRVIPAGDFCSRILRGLLVLSNASKLTRLTSCSCLLCPVYSSRSLRRRSCRSRSCSRSTTTPRTSRPGSSSRSRSERSVFFRAGQASVVAEEPVLTGTAYLPPGHRHVQGHDGQDHGRLGGEGGEYEFPP